MDAPEPGGLGGTFAGNPVACAAALAILEIMNEDFFARGRAIGVRIDAALRALQPQFKEIADVRGLGAMMAMELSLGAEAIVEEARRRGLLLLLAGERDVIRILVPLVVSDAELDEGMAILGAATAQVFAE
jgi:4-aminobutyrate aminotransferase/(S)-3-amino-2-methylpropionate transaminase